MAAPTMGFTCMVAGSACMCIRHTPHWPCAATTSAAPVWRKAQMSLMMSAPASKANRITAGLQVSTETGTCQPTAAFTTAWMRAHSVAASTAAAPGREDSPPMSKMCAPSCNKRSACAMAAVAWGCWPPSENESGVTFTMPITQGLDRSRRNRVVCQKDAWGRSPMWW